MFGEENMSGKLMAVIGSSIGLGFSWGEVLQSAVGALAGAIVAIAVNEGWKAIKKYRAKKKDLSDE